MGTFFSVCPMTASTHTQPQATTFASGPLFWRKYGIYVLGLLTECFREGLYTLLTLHYTVRCLVMLYGIIYSRQSNALRVVTIG